MSAGARFAVGLPKAPSPRVCEKCGCRAMCKDSINYVEYIRRRYHCKCGERWSTYEVREDQVEFEETVEPGDGHEDAQPSSH